MGQADMSNRAVKEMANLLIRTSRHRSAFAAQLELVDPARYLALCNRLGLDPAGFETIEVYEAEEER